MLISVKDLIGKYIFLTKLKKDFRRCFFSIKCFWISVPISVIDRFAQNLLLLSQEEE